jgi:uncharacterized repeat protein (TIGR03803 family)
VNRIAASFIISAILCLGVVLIPVADASSYSVLYRFCGQSCGDGAQPWANLINVNGTLYGTTLSGGTYDGGTLFALDLTTGTETVLHDFGGSEDGAGPLAGLIDIGGTLYGTTGSGGVYNNGTVFSVNPTTGAETVIHDFGGTGDGYEPFSGLVKVKGTLYGTTFRGGTYGQGVVFSIKPKTGKETVLYPFEGAPDAANPEAGVINVGGALYGTTFNGGTGACSPGMGPCGDGAVFSIDSKTGAETLIYSFCPTPPCSDGSQPEAGLFNVGGTLYGTTAGGGLCSYGCGTVFSVDSATGAEAVLYSFCSQQNCVDGAEPYASLIKVGDRLFGTTRQGGANGWGTVFSIGRKTGAEQVVYSFCSQSMCADGAEPQAGLINVSGTLYGTTFEGGTDSCEFEGHAVGCGTVFSITR